VKKSLRTSFPAGLFLLVFLLCAYSPSSAVNLAAVEGIWTPPDGASSIRMWGFIKDPGTCPVTPATWTPGPVQQGNVNGTLTITLRNCLSEPVSLIIPGLMTTLQPTTFVDSKGRTRVRSFTAEVPADNGTSTLTYTWTNLDMGTYLYQSGSHPAKQVPMGLYGSATVGRHPSAVRETLLLLSEIDPDQHVTAQATTPLNYKPKYFLINGRSAVPGGRPPVINNTQPGKTVQLRFLNAGLMTRVPTLQGPYMQIFAEDGNSYPYQRQQYSVNLPAGKTVDALWLPGSTGSYALYDRRLGMTTGGVVGGGMLQTFGVKKFPWILFIPPMIPPPF